MTTFDSDAASKSMNWTMLGAVGELLGAVAVVVSLLYVGRQLRHSARLAAVEGVDSLTALQVQWARSVVDDRRLAGLVFRIHYEEATPTDFENDERVQIGYLYWTLHVMQASLFERLKAGLILRHDYEQFANRYAGLFSAPYHAAVWWPFLRDNLPSAYRQDVETTWPLPKPEEAE